MGNPSFLRLIADVEGGLILSSAFRSYAEGVDVAAIITAHASCERDLMVRAAHWQSRGESGPQDFNRWGLGRLIGFYRSALPEDLITALEQLNDRRKTLYHYGYSESVTGIIALTYAYIAKRTQTALYAAYQELHAQAPDPKELLAFAEDEMLRDFALESLRAASRVREWANA